MLRRAEDYGYTSYLALDHFVRGFDTVASLAAAAMVTSMRIGSFVSRQYGDTDWSGRG